MVDNLTQHCTYQTVDKLDIIKAFQTSETMTNFSTAFLHFWYSSFKQLAVTFRPELTKKSSKYLFHNYSDIS